MVGHDREQRGAWCASGDGRWPSGGVNETKPPFRRWHRPAQVLDPVWEAMDAETGPGPTGQVRRRLNPESAYDLFLTQDRPSRALGLLAVFDGKVGAAWRTLQSSAGLDIRVAAMPGTRPSIQLV